MQGVRFTGFFTVDGSDLPPSEETYEIHSVQKFGEEDLWIFTARIKYGKKGCHFAYAFTGKVGGGCPDNNHAGLEYT